MAEQHSINRILALLVATALALAACGSKTAQAGARNGADRVERRRTERGANGANAAGGAGNARTRPRGRRRACSPRASCTSTSTAR